MKKLTYLFLVLFTVAFFSTSCEKEKDIESPEPNGITSDQLLGTWDFLSFEKNDNIYNGCSDELTNIYGYWGSINICFSYEYHDDGSKDVRIGWGNPCESDFDFDYSKEPFELINDKISLEEYPIIFSIEYLDDNTLKLKWVKLFDETNLINGILTLEKE